MFQCDFGILELKKFINIKFIFVIIKFYLIGSKKEFI